MIPIQQMKLIFYQPLHHKNLASIKRMCDSMCIQLEVTSDFNRIKQNNYDILIANHSFVKPEFIPENVKIIYGPQHWVFPEGEIIGPNNTEYNKKCVYNSLSKWVEELYLEMAESLIMPISQFPFSVDTETFKPGDVQKTLDCVLYIKRRESTVVERVIEILNKKELSYKIFRYGSYNEADYLKTLHICKFMVVLDASESQGFALQEAMSCDIPLLVLDVKSMHDEYENGFTYEYLKSKKLIATSVPYWSDECGIKIDRIEDIDKSMDTIICKRETYKPREYIISMLTDEICMKRILDYFEIM